MGCKAAAGLEGNAMQGRMRDRDEQVEGQATKIKGNKVFKNVWLHICV